MRYGEGLLEEILRRTDIVQLVGRRVKLARKGRMFWGCCPFHKENTPSFKVENERRTYKCFGCGAGGDAFKWLMETEGLSFPEAVQKLAGEAGVELPQWSAEDEARETRRKSLYEIVELACRFYEEQLKLRAGDAARSYLESRALNADIRKRFRLGYAPSGTALKEHLAGKSVGLEHMIEAGLVRPGEEGRAPRDFFFDRVTFPISDPRGRVVAFGARTLKPDVQPKYINTGETALFSKGRLLYNLHAAREAALKGSTLVVAEGYMDVIALVRAGLEASVAPLGTALTEDQLSLLWRLAPEPVLCFDGDEAGARAARRAARLALGSLAPGQSLRFAFLPTGDDPDDVLRAQGAAALRTMIEKARALSDVLWAGETEGRDFSTPERRAGLEAELDKIVREIRHPKIADYYRSDFSDRVFQRFKRAIRARPGQAGRGTGYGKRAFEKDARGGGARDEVSAAVRDSALARNAGDSARRIKEMELSGLMIGAPALIERHAEAIAALGFADPQLDSLRRELLHLAASGVRLDERAVETHLVRQGMGGLAERLKTRRVVGRGPEGESHDEDSEARWLRAVAQFRDLIDFDVRRDRALERHLADQSEESWSEVQKLLGDRARPAD